jgi:hypothetical protein
VAEFYLDHNAAAEIAEYLRAAGEGARTARDLGLERARDQRQLLEAARNGWILVTYDFDDFRLLNDAWREWPLAWGIEPPRHAGVLVIPAPDRGRQLWLPNQAAQQLHSFVSSGRIMTNMLYRWWAAHGWVRY